MAPPFAHHYPSNYNLGNIIAVAATDHNDQMAYFSNFGIKTVALRATGDGILSTLPGNNYDIYSGTSMASPMLPELPPCCWPMILLPDGRRTIEQSKILLAVYASCLGDTRNEQL